MAEQKILDSIPHRPPFLFVDKILEQKEDSIRAEWYLDPELDFFRGHYPHQPIVPGVLLCEAIFQTSAIMLAERIRNEEGETTGKTPVLARIQEARFREMVIPEDTVVLEVQWKEKLGRFHFCQGTIWKNDKKAVTLEFALVLT